VLVKYLGRPQRRVRVPQGKGGTGGVTFEVIVAAYSGSIAQPSSELRKISHIRSGTVANDECAAMMKW
jgi:hypothetical protein